MSAKSDNEKYLYGELLQIEDLMLAKRYQKSNRSNIVIPKIAYKLAGENDICEIKIFFYNAYERVHKKVDYKSIDLLNLAFWQKINKSENKYHAIAYSLPANLDGLKLYETDCHIDDTEYSYPIPYPTDRFYIIWQKYCMITGKASILRHEFCLWIYRINCLFYDLIINPLIREERNDFRRSMLVGAVKSKHSAKYEYFVADEWDKLLRDDFTLKDAHEARLVDARILLNHFNDDMKSVDPLVNFLRSIYDDFGKLLLKKSCLLKCEQCGKYMKYHKGKKYCSLKSDGRDCAKDKATIIL